MDEKKEFLKRHHIALWDVIQSCTMIGSSDSSIKNVFVNDIKSLINKTEIKCIYTTGRKAYDLYNKFCYEKVGIKATLLPSTSPANASMGYEKILETYKNHLAEI